MDMQKQHSTKTAIKFFVSDITSWPGPGAGPSQFGGGPPYFLCPGVTSCEYPVLWRISCKQKQL